MRGINGEEYPERPIEGWRWEWGWIAFALACTVAFLAILAVVVISGEAKRTASVCSEIVSEGSRLAVIDASILEAHVAAHGRAVISEGP